MRILALPLLVATFAGTQTASAQNEVIYACQHTDASGFNWENGDWSQGPFYPAKPFFLKAVDGRLVASSVQEAIGGMGVSCSSSTAYPNLETCHEELGGALHFNHISATGAESQMYGSGQSDKLGGKDTVTVSIFTCQRM